MDKVYKTDIPALVAALRDLRRQFAAAETTTDWIRLRIEPLLAHARTLLRLQRSPRFARETSRLPRGVVMFHSDLVYLRENVKALRSVLPRQGTSPRGRSSTGSTPGSRRPG